jgi:hypothetical protein
MEFARCLDIAIKSTSEVDYQLRLARDLGVLAHDICQPLAREVVERRSCCPGYAVPFSLPRRSSGMLAPRNRRTSDSIPMTRTAPLTHVEAA